MDSPSKLVIMEMVLLKIKEVVQIEYEIAPQKPQNLLQINPHSKTRVFDMSFLTCC
jgi:hypothetical protein